VQELRRQGLAEEGRQGGEVPEVSRDGAEVRGHLLRYSKSNALSLTRISSRQCAQFGKYLVDQPISSAIIAQVAIVASKLIVLG